MKGRAIIAELRGLKSDIANVRGWLDAIEGRADKIIESLAAQANPTPQQPETQPEPEPSFPVEPTDGRDEWTPPSKRGAVVFDGDPKAKSLTTLITPKQIGMIRALAREAGVDYEVECQEQFNGVKIESLNKRAASAFIDYLKALQEQGADFQVRRAV